MDIVGGPELERESRGVKQENVSIAIVADRWQPAAPEPDHKVGLCKQSEGCTGYINTHRVLKIQIGLQLLCRSAYVCAERRIRGYRFKKL